MATKYSFGVEPISCHAWNKDRTQLAMSQNDSEVNIYQTKAGKWEKIHTLSEHSQRVTSVDWAPESNRIVTCGADRNAYVWILTEGKWKPTLVILRINRAATCVRWSPQENKFAVASGARLIAICYFEPEYDWWVSKHIKKPLRSTVTSIDWHPNNALFACGSTDFKVRVFSGYIKEVESKPQPCSWGTKMSNGTVMAEFSNGQGGWVHDVAFDASGTRLAWIGHDSSISVVDSDNGNKMTTLKSKFLPFVSCIWVTHNNLVVAGHDSCPMLFNYDDNGNLTFSSKLDVPKQKAGGGGFSALAKFQNLDKRAQADDDSGKTTIHENTITQISAYEGGKDRITQFSTSGVDGQMVIWNFKSLESSIAGLKI